MTLSIEHISLERFRGYDSARLDGLEHLVIIVGPNAAGKTNIVEALQLLTSGNSFRKPNWSELPTWGEENCRISLAFADGKRHVEHEMVIDGAKRSYFVNGKKKAASAIRGFCPAVLFIPDDLQMVKASSAKRRDSLDEVAVQLSKQYSSLKKEYAQVLRQRNMLLRDDLAQGMLFESWNDALVVHGSRLFVNRYRLFKRLAGHMERIHAQLVPGERFDVAYIPSWERFDDECRQLGDVQQLEDLAHSEYDSIDAAKGALSAAVQRLAGVERQRKTSLAGPHKDEVAFFINGRNARLFASQGQQRTIVLAWKLAAVELVREMVGNEPVLLLDDVMSELDEDHRNALTSFINRSSQTFITTTNLGYFSQDLLDQAQVIRLPLPPQNE